MSSTTRGAWFPSIVLTCFSGFLSGPVLAQTDTDTPASSTDVSLVLHFDERDWQLGSKEVTENRAVFEYVPPGETIENWSELVIVRTLKGLQNMRLKDQVRFIKESLLENCPDGVWNIIEQSDRTVLYEWKAMGCTGSNDSDGRYEVSKILRDSWAMHRVAYSSRKESDLSDTDRSDWIDRVARAEIKPGENSSHMGGEAEPQLATVVITREEKGGQKRWNVLLDETPIAVLGRRSYISVDTEPGWHLLWGDCEPEWFEFEAGRTYLIRVLRGARFPCNVDSSAVAGSLILEQGLEQYVPTEESLGDLDAELAKYEKVRKKAGEAPVDSGPMEIERVSYKAELSKFGATMGGYKFAKGNLTVTDSTLLYHSKKHDLAIHTVDIRRVSRIQSPKGTYVAVEYVEDDVSRMAYFFCPMAS